MFCSNCGAKLDDGVNFCPNCGAKVKVVEANVSDSEEKEVVAETVEEVAVETPTEEDAEEELKEETPAVNENIEKEEETPDNGDQDDSACEETQANENGNAGSKGIFDGVFDFSDNTRTAIQAVAAFFALSFIGHSVSNLIGGVQNVTTTFSKLYNVPAALFWFLSSVMRFAVGASAVGIIIVLLLMFFEWDEEKTQKYFLTLGELSILVTLAALLRSVTYSIYCSILISGSTTVGYWSTFWSIFGTALLMCGAFYGMSVGFKLPLFEDLSETNFKEKAIEAPKAVYAQAKEFFDAKKSAHEAKKAEEAKANGYNTPEMKNGKVPEGGSSKPFIPLKTDRNLFVVIVLSIITCGIYELFFLHRLIEDVNTACEGDGEDTAGLLALIILSMITCGIYGYVWYYKLGNRLQTNGNRYGIPMQENGTTILLWMLVGSLLCGVGPIIAFYIIIKNTNLICAAYNNYNYNN